MLNICGRVVLVLVIVIVLDMTGLTGLIEHEHDYYVGGFASIRRPSVLKVR